MWLIAFCFSPLFADKKVVYNFFVTIDTNNKIIKILQWMKCSMKLSMLTPATKL